MRLRRDKPRKFFACRWATRATLRKPRARRGACAKRQLRRDATRVGCADSTAPLPFHASVIVVLLQQRCGVTILGAGARSAAAAAEQPPLLRSPRDLAVQSIVQATAPDGRPWMASGAGASLHFAACAESMRRCHVARHRVIRRRRVCHGETLPAGRVCSDAFQ